MAGFTRQVDRRYVIARFRNRRHTEEHLAIVTIDTATGDPGMVHYARSRARTGRMTQRTGLCRRQVPCRQRTGCPGKTDRREVAHRTVVCCNYVRGRCIRLVFWCDTGKCQSISMTLRTVVHDAHMVHRRSGEVGELARRVTGLASQIGRDVIDRFRYRCHSKEHLAVVTGITASGDAGMVHHARSRTSACRMTQRTGLRRRNVS